MSIGSVDLKQSNFTASGCKSDPCNISNGWTYHNNIFGFILCDCIGRHRHANLFFFFYMENVEGRIVVRAITSLETEELVKVDELVKKSRAPNAARR